jgi:peptidoglycan hydrolase-like protein with peptidoglycan-binding domain
MSLQSIRLRRQRRLVTAANNNPPMGMGETGEAVETLQQALIDLGFPMQRSTRKTGFPDGIYGKETSSTVRAFQTRERLSTDGIAGPETLGRLDQILLLVERKDQAQLLADVTLPPPLRKYNAS